MSGQGFDDEVFEDLIDSQQDPKARAVAMVLFRLIQEDREALDDLRADLEAP